MNEKLPTAREVRSHIEPASREKSYLKAFALLAAVTTFYVITFVGCVAPQWWIQLICIPANGLAIGMLFVIGHDACHSCYTPGRRTDHWIARLTLAPSLFPNECWKTLHNYFHHGFTCLKGKDHAWQPVGFLEFDKFPLWRQRLEQHYKSFAGIATNWIVEVWWKHAVAPRGESRYFLGKRSSYLIVDCIVVVTFLLSALLAAIILRKYFTGRELDYLIILEAILFGLLLPFWFFSLQAGLAILVQHTHPSTVWFANKEEWNYFAANIRCTVHFRYPFPINKIYLDVMEHNAHHVDTSIPIYNLIGQQRNLEAAYPDDIIVEDFSIATLKRIFKTCQLYDYELHCWLSFEGKPTTKPVNLENLAMEGASSKG